MSDPSQDRLRRLADLWRRERAATDARFREAREGVPLRERVARGLALDDLQIEETDAVAGGRLLLWVGTRRGDPGAVRFGPGTPVRLWWDDPWGDDSVRGTVARRRGDRLAVVVDDDLPERFDDPGFRLDEDAPRTTFDRGDRAIRAFRDARPGSEVGRLRGVLLGDRPPAFRAEEPLAPHDADLNPPQVAAVRRALAADDVALIHGPPGTGKTRTLVEVVRQALGRGERVLVTAASNTAVDNLAERLAAAGVEVVRLGHPARVLEAVQARTLDALVDATEASALARRWMREAEALRRRLEGGRRGGPAWSEKRALRAELWRLQRDARTQLEGARAAVLARCRAVCATAAGADAAALRDERFDLVVLDEATQAPDPMALVALARGARVVMAGDPHQLPPTVIDPAAERAGLGETMFERLAARCGDEALRLLTVQHRMHATLMAFPSRAVYGGRLEAAPAVAARTLADLPGVAEDPLRPGPLVFVDAAGKGWEEARAADDPSTANPAQADRTAAEVRRLLGRGLPAEDAAVITPYDAQVRALRDRLGPELAAGLEIGSVDGFQGREKEGVVVDLVRSNEAGELGFLADVRRMNVALTRARRFLLVVGDSATLGAHPFYAAFMQAAEEAGGWLSAWSDDAPPFEG